MSEPAESMPVPAPELYLQPSGIPQKTIEYEPSREQETLEAEQPQAPVIIEPPPLSTQVASGEPRPVFDPSTVTPEEKSATLTDISSYIDALNEIIRRKDYEAWLARLTKEYIDYYSDSGVLATLSESPVLRRQGIRLSSLRDYFLHVVYPSRQHDKVEDIEFLGEKRVKVILISSKGEPLVLYSLEKQGNVWMIGLWRY